jgi:hypothetical protein
MPAQEPREIFPTGDKEKYGSKNHDQEQLSVQIVTPPYSEATHMPFELNEIDCHDLGRMLLFVEKVLIDVLRQSMTVPRHGSPAVWKGLPGTCIKSFRRHSAQDPVGGRGIGSADTRWQGAVAFPVRHSHNG